MNDFKSYILPILFFFLFFMNAASAKNMFTPINLNSFKHSFYSEIKSEHKLTLVLSVPVGHADDPEGYPDLTHLMEHLFLTTNGNFTKNAILKNNSASGITQSRNTQYVITIQPGDIDKTFKHFDDFFNHPEFKTKDIIAQLHEIKEEENPKDVEEMKIIKYVQSLANPEHFFSKADFLPTNKLKKKTIPSIQQELTSLHREKYQNNTSLILYASKENLRKVKNIDKKYSYKYKFNSTEGMLENQLKLKDAFIKTSSSINKIKSFSDQTSDNLYFISPIMLKKIIVNDLDINIFEYLIKLRGTGSLYNDLHREGLISNVDFENVNIDVLQDLFITTFKLTDKGKKNVREVKEKYSAYLKYITEFYLSADVLHTISKRKEFNLLMPDGEITSNLLVQSLGRNDIFNYKNMQAELSQPELLNIYLDFKHQVLPLLIQNQIVCFGFTEHTMPIQAKENRRVSHFDLSRINSVKYEDYPGYDVIKPNKKPILIFQNNFSQSYFKYARSDVKTAKVIINLHFKTESKADTIKTFFYQQGIQQNLANWKDISKTDGSLIKIEENFTLKGKPVTSIIFYTKEEEIFNKINQLTEMINIFPIKNISSENQKAFLKSILKEQKTHSLEEGGLDFILQVVPPNSISHLSEQDIEKFDFNELSDNKKLAILKNVSMFINGDVSNSTINQLKLLENSNPLFSEDTQLKASTLLHNSHPTKEEEKDHDLRSFGKSPDVTIIEYKLKDSHNPMLAKLLHLGMVLDNYDYFKQKIDTPYYKYHFIEFNKSLYYNFYYSDKDPELILEELKKYLSKNYKKNQLFKFYLAKYFIKKKISSSNWHFREYNRYYQMELINQNQMFDLQIDFLKSWHDFSYWEYKKSYKKYILNPEKINIYTNNLAYLSK